MTTTPLLTDADIRAAGDVLASEVDDDGWPPLAAIIRGLQQYGKSAG